MHLARRQAVGCRVGVEASKRAGHRRSTFVVVGPQGVECHGELRAGHRSVVAKSARQADMIVTSFDPGVRVAEIAWNTGANPNRTLRFNKAWRLLDMQFQVGADA